MAVDHALLESVQAGGAPVLRLYRWDPACLSFGRNQHVAGLYDPAELRAAGIDVVRRPTGGLAVLHDCELTYCVLAPIALFGGPRAAYTAINRSLVAALRSMGIAADLAGAATRPRDPRRDAAQPCFQAPAPGEVVAAGRKLIGSAQRCEGRTLLQHGSILVDGSQRAVAALLHAAPAGAVVSPGAAAVSAAGGGGAAPTAADAAARPLPGGVPGAAGAPGGGVTLRVLLGAAPAWEVLVAACVAGFASLGGTPFAPTGLSRDEAARATELERIYAAGEWTWRR
jgi:lipoyl(octanoyl) transferase